MNFFSDRILFSTDFRSFSLFFDSQFNRRFPHYTYEPISHFTDFLEPGTSPLTLRSLASTPKLFISYIVPLDYFKHKLNFVLITMKVDLFRLFLLHFAFFRPLPNPDSPSSTFSPRFSAFSRSPTIVSRLPRLIHARFSRFSKVFSRRPASSPVTILSHSSTRTEREPTSFYYRTRTRTDQFLQTERGTENSLQRTAQSKLVTKTCKNFRKQQQPAAETSTVALQRRHQVLPQCVVPRRSTRRSTTQGITAVLPARRSSFTILHSHSDTAAP